MRYAPANTTLHVRAYRIRPMPKIISAAIPNACTSDLSHVSRRSTRFPRPKPFPRRDFPSHEPSSDVPWNYSLHVNTGKRENGADAGFAYAFQFTRPRGRDLTADFAKTMPKAPVLDRKNTKLLKVIHNIHPSNSSNASTISKYTPSKAAPKMRFPACWERWRYDSR